MRFGLIGLGAAGELRKAAIERMPNSSLTAVSDANPERMRLAGPNATRFHSAAALLASTDCEAVIVSTPPDSHEHLVVAALESGKHVLVEKPMANSVAACERMVQASRRTGRLLAVGFNHRYFASFQLLRHTIVSGAIGKLSHIRGYAGHTGLPELTQRWMYQKTVMGGGTLMDNGIHMIDLVAFLMGGVASVAGKVSSDIWRLDGVEDNAFAVLRGPDGVVATLQSSWTEWKGYRFIIEVYGDRGMASASYAPMTSTIITMNQPGGGRRVKRQFYPFTIIREKLRGWQSTAVDAFAQELNDFNKLIDGGGGNVLIARGEEGLRAVAIAYAIYESSESNAWLRPIASG